MSPAQAKRADVVRGIARLRETRGAIGRVYLHVSPERLFRALLDNDERARDLLVAQLVAAQLRADAERRSFDAKYHPNGVAK